MSTGTGPRPDEVGSEPQHVVVTRPFNEAMLEGARIYAEALINAAQHEGNVEEVLNELHEFRDDILTRHPTFAQLIISTSLSIDQKDRILTDAFEGRALPLLLNFLRVLNRHSRLNILGPILDRAQEIWDRRQNRRPVTVRSALPLDDGQRQALHDRLAQVLGGGATPILHLEVDPDLIGGLVIQIGDDRYDLSVRNRLQQLRAQLLDVKGAEIRTQSQSFLG